MRKVNLCAIVKNEGPYLAEWLEYHIVMGVNHFFLYDHGSMDSSRAIMNKYADLGLLTVTDWGHIDVPAQKLAYHHCLSQVQNSVFENDWLGFLDCDEFAVTTHVSLPETLRQIVRLQTGIVVANWVLFGSSGHVEKPEGLVIQNYTHSEPGFNQHVKCFCIPSRTDRPGNDAHTFIPKYGFKVITAFGEETLIGTPFHPIEEGKQPPLYIHHYHTKSQAEYKKRCLRGRVDMIQKKKFEDNFEHHDRNEKENPFITVFIEQINYNIQKRNIKFKETELHPWKNL